MKLRKVGLRPTLRGIRSILLENIPELHIYQRLVLGTYDIYEICHLLANVRYQLCR